MSDHKHPDHHHDPHQDDCEHDHRHHMREDIRQLIFRPPHWMVRFGMSVFALILGGVLVGAWLVRYPELMRGKITITTANPPIALVAIQAGRLEHLMVADGDWVTKDQPLAVMESGAVYEHVHWLTERLATPPPGWENPSTLNPSSWRRDLSLAELEVPYAQFLKRLQETVDFMEASYTRKKIQIFEARAHAYEQLNEKIQSRLAIQREDYQMSEKVYLDQRKLYNKGHIAAARFAEIQSEYLEKKALVESVEENLWQNHIEISNLRQAVVEAEQDEDRLRRGHLTTLAEARQTLEGAVLLWQKRYLFKAPTDGNISLSRLWAADHFVAETQEIMTVIPGEQRCIGLVELPSYGAGKVAPGQPVQIKLDSYPYKEYGVVLGEVAALSPLAREQGFLLKISFPNGLLTDHHKQLPLKYNMEGWAEIITQDLSLLERIFIHFRYLTSQIERG